MTIPGVVYIGANGRPLKRPKADWLANPALFSLPPFVREYPFAQHTGRNWRFDIAWPHHRVALEIDGGSAIHGRHSRPAGMRKDNEKLNTAAAMGWRVLRVLKGEETRVALLELLLETLTYEHGAVA